jgi:hypothetical protein
MDWMQTQYWEVVRLRFSTIVCRIHCLRLGIDEYAKLAQKVTIVIHSAWKMNFNQGMEYFEDDRIAGNCLLLNSSVPRPKVFANDTYRHNISAPSSPRRPLQDFRVHQ